QIHRLQTLLASSEPSGRKPAGERKAGLRRQRKLSGALLSLSRSVQELTEENQSLKEDLDRVLSSSPTVARTKGCVEWSKPRLLRRIAELEKKIRSLESPPPQASDGGRSDALVLCASSTWGHRQEDGERQDDGERLRGALRSLKGERKALRAQLQERDLEVRQLLQAKADVEKELEEVRRGEEARRAREAALREEIQALTRKCQDLQAAKEAEEDDPTEGTPEAPEEPRPGPAGSPSPQDSEPGASEDSPSQPCACSEQRRHAAASTLQARWKVYRRQKREAALGQAATVLQAAFRGHLARARLLASPACGPGPPSVPGLPSQSPPSPRPPSPVVQAEGDPRQEAAVTLIQSVFRAHLARVGHRDLGKEAAVGAPRCHRGVRRGQWGDPSLPLWFLSAEPPPSSAPWEDVSSDDSDEVIMAPALPAKRSPS
uniref:IQ motif containing E n=1 Tax=Myotis lucifugus TaxID=59463 RepID=G1PUJ2_MYOLU